MIATVTLRLLQTAAAVFLAALLAGGAPAAGLVTEPCAPPAAPLPDWVLSSVAPLRAEYGRVGSRAKTLDARLVAFNARCRSLKAGSAEESACATDKAGLLGEWAQYEKTRRSYEKARADKLSALLAEADSREQQSAERLPKTRGLLRNVPKANEAWQKDIEDWTGLKQIAREEAVRNATRNLLDIGAGAALAKVKDAKELSADSLGDSIKRGETWYKSYGQVLPEAQRARTLNLIRAMKSDADALEVIEVAKDQFDVQFEFARAVLTPEREANLSLLAEAIVSVVDIVQHDTPAAMMYRNARTILIDVGYGWAATLVAKNRMQEIIGLEEQGLSDASRISRMYIDDVNMRKTLPQMKERIRALQNECNATGEKR